MSTAPVIFIVVVSDHHADDTLIPYFDRDKALHRAADETKEMCSHYRTKAEVGLNDFMRQAGWQYYALCSEEGDSVRVEQHQVRE